MENYHAELIGKPIQASTKNLEIPAETNIGKGKLTAAQKRNKRRREANKRNGTNENNSAAAASAQVLVEVEQHLNENEKECNGVKEIDGGNPEHIKLETTVLASAGAGVGASAEVGAGTEVDVGAGEETGLVAEEVSIGQGPGPGPTNLAQAANHQVFQACALPVLAVALRARFLAL